MDYDEVEKKTSNAVAFGRSRRVTCTDRYASWKEVIHPKTLAGEEANTQPWSICTYLGSLLTTAIKYAMRLITKPSMLTLDISLPIQRLGCNPSLARSQLVISFQADLQ